MKPTIGRIVHFVQNDVHYAAIITKVWTPTCVNLRVFRNASDSIVPGALDANDNAKSINYNDANAEWSWHWPEREGE